MPADADGARLLRLKPRSEQLPGPVDDPADAVDDDEPVARREARADAEPAGERRVERDLADDPAEHPVRADHGDLPLGGERRLAPDGETAADDPHVRSRADRAPERSAILAFERDLDGAASREAVGPLRRERELILIGGERRAEPGLEPNVDPARLRALHHGAESERRGRQRQQRQHQEVADQLDLETHGVKACRQMPIANS